MNDTALILTLIGGLLASVIVKVFTHKVKELHPATVVTLLGLVSYLGSFLQWVASNGPAGLGGFHIVGVHAAEIISVATFAYQYVVKPLYGMLYAEKLADAPIGADGPADAPSAPVETTSTWTNKVAAPDVMTTTPGEASF